MIANSREFEVTLIAIREFEKALEKLTEERWQDELHRDAIASVLEELREEVCEWLNR